ncbi:hypothetical protein PVAND_017860 [Polypedilum vanderplanki]|uniref:Peptidase S1 domain-containing protein n=1 Tax=Polypedilum vanderplanki TaxID=319348 RepID=A0A9J6B9D9_POLVA|nr:hypothetical protein PVAND_017860 [Polypedilum vanderplanki]
MRKFCLILFLIFSVLKTCASKEDVSFYTENNLRNKYGDDYYHNSLKTTVTGSRKTITFDTKDRSANIVPSVLGGTGAGAAAGAAIGSAIVPLIGTVIGGFLGATVGAVTGSVVSGEFPKKKTHTLYFDIGTDIIGGTPTSISNHPYIVSLRYNGNHVCGGSIVDDNKIVTAAHCLEDNDHTKYTVRVGSTYRDQGGSIFQIIRIRKHHSYNPNTYDYDVAVVETFFILTGGIAQRISLTISEPQYSSYLTAAGWGMTDYLPGSNELLEVSIQYVNREICNTYYPSRITERMICAGLLGKGACRGDSGGPLVQNGILYGIVSWGSSNRCSKISPDVYANVADLHNWIIAA